MWRHRQVPLEQVWPEGHAAPQPPQSLVVVSGRSQPLRCCASQSPQPGSQGPDALHESKTQTPGRCGCPGQECPQLLQ